MKITAHGNSHIGRIRQTNEDYFLHEKIAEEENLFVVADGMGGHQAGDVASRLGALSFSTNYKRLRRRGKSVPEAMKEALEKANGAILRKAQLDPKKKGMGTTFSGMVVHENRLYAIHVGDSRIYLIRDGAIRQLTTDQTFVAKMVEDGRITEEEARDHPQKNILYMSLGARDRFTPEVLVDLILEDGDIAVICSDGLNSYLPDDVIRAFAEAYYPREAVEGLIRRANESGGGDNITAQVIRFGPVGDLDNTVALHRVEKKRRFPYLWLLAALILMLILVVVFRKGNPSDLPRTTDGIAVTPDSGSMGVPVRILDAQRVALPSFAKTLLKSDPRHLIHYSDGWIWLFSGDRYHLIGIDSPTQTRTIVLPASERLIPNPENRMLVLTRKRSRVPEYLLKDEKTGQTLLELQQDEDMDVIDQPSRTISMFGLKPPVDPIFINQRYFLFTSHGVVCIVENPLDKREVIHLIKCRFEDERFPLCHSLRMDGGDLVLLMFTTSDRQIRLCRIRSGQEPLQRVIPYAIFQDPLAIEFLPGGGIMVYFPDHASLLDVSGTSHPVGFKGDIEGSQVSRVVVDPSSPNRLAVTENGSLFKVWIR